MYILLNWKRVGKLPTAKHFESIYKEEDREKTPPITKYTHTHAHKLYLAIYLLFA